MYLVGTGAEVDEGAGVSSLSARAAAEVCRDKRDFVDFEPIRVAGRRLVITTERGDKSFASAQAHHATSLAAWLQEPKPDGAGQVSNVFHDEEPNTRKRFTDAQIDAIVRFARRGQ